jgi:hypothetical protein
MEARIPFRPECPHHEVRAGHEPNNETSRETLPRNDFRTNEHSFSHAVPEFERGPGCKP